MKTNSMLFILTVVSITSLGHSRCMLERGDLFDRFHFRHATKYYDPETGLYYYGERYYSPELGRWINRDPIEEQDGPGLYLFLKNDAINKWDFLGLWSDLDRKGKSWATVCCNKGDTWESLAASLGLDSNEANKWVKNYTSSPKAGKKYEVPNAVVIYKSNPEYYWPKKINNNDPWSIANVNISKDIPVYWYDGADLMRTAAETKGVGLDKAGYRVIRIESNSRSILINSWRTEGLFGFIYGGHGFDGALVTSQSRLETVYSSYVNPPYKLGLIELYACQTFDDKNGWMNHLSPNGMIVTMKGSVMLFNMPFSIDIWSGQK